LSPADLTLCAKGLSACGQSDEALRAVTEGVDIAKRTGEYLYLPQAMRVQAGLERLCGHAQTPETESGLLEDLNLARVHDQSLFELQIAVSIAKLRGDEDRRLEASDVLSPIYARFTEGYDTPVLKEAAALLLELP
jgi:hypothetical protein